MAESTARQESLDQWELVVQAREHQRLGQLSATESAHHRHERDTIVRRLRTENPTRWTYSALAAAIGCSPELIAVIVKHND